LGPIDSDPLCRASLSKNKIGYCTDIAAANHRHGGIGYFAVADDRAYRIVFCRNQRCIRTGAPDFQLRMIVMFETLDEHQVHIADLLEQFTQRRLGSIGQLDNMRPAPGRSDNDFACTRGPMLITVFAGMIDIELVVCVLDGCHAQTASCQFANHIDDQRRLAGIFISGYTKNFHVSAPQNCRSGHNHDRVITAGSPRSNRSCPQGCSDQAFAAQTLHQPFAATALPGKIPQGR